MEEYELHSYDKVLADKYEKKISRLFQDKTRSKRKKKKTPSRKQKSPNFFGGKQSHKKRTRKHRK